MEIMISELQALSSSRTPARRYSTNSIGNYLTLALGCFYFVSIGLLLPLPIGAFEQYVPSCGVGSGAFVTSPHINTGVKFALKVNNVVYKPTEKIYVDPAKTYTIRVEGVTGHEIFKGVFVRIEQTKGTAGALKVTSFTNSTSNIRSVEACDAPVYGYGHYNEFEKEYVAVRLKTTGMVQGQIFRLNVNVIEDTKHGGIQEFIIEVGTKPEIAPPTKKPTSAPTLAPTKPIPGVMAGYRTSWKVSDEANIDQDQAGLNAVLKSDATGFAAGKKVYISGGHSGPYAVLRISPSFSRIAAGTTVTGTDSTKATSIVGTVMKSTAMFARSVQVAYIVDDGTPLCQVGGLSSSLSSFTGCFAASGTVKIGTRNVKYSYNPTTNNYNYRTLQVFSTNAASQYKISGQYFPLFNNYLSYYGDANFGDVIIQNAFDGTAATFTSKGIVYDFTKYDFVARSEVVKKGIQLFNVLFQIVYEMEMSLTTCSSCYGTGLDCESMYALDKAVAYYVGSLESSDGKPVGVTLFQLADSRCVTFKTCGVNGTSTTGRSQANYIILDLFKQFRNALTNRKCTDATILKNIITQKLYIPIIQSTLLSLYNTAVVSNSNDKQEAEGFTYATALAPQLASCSTTDATTLATNMRIGQDKSASITDVRAALEKNYGCLNVTCPEIGGIWYINRYRTNFAPCK